MDLLSAVFSPLASLRLDDDDGGIDILYPLTCSIAFGIWFLYRRYTEVTTRAVPFAWPTPEAASSRWESTVIDEPSLEAHMGRPQLLPPFQTPGKKYITCYDPSTALHLGTFVADGTDEITQKIEKAVEAQKSWKPTNFAERQRVVRTLMKWLVDNREACAKVSCRDTGKTMVDAALGEILTTCSKMEWLLVHGEKVLKPEKRSTNLLLSYKSSKVYYEPLGVVAAIVSWNYPIHNAISPILAGIFAGNGVVVKCSEQVIWSTSWLMGAVTQCLRTCGHDPDLVQLVCCYPEDAEALTASPLIKHITFIGSETVGRKVAMAATQHLTPVNLELGGKDPAIVLPGTEVKRYMSTWMRGIYQNAGQNCIGIERLIVHESLYEEIVRTLDERVKRLRCGSVLAPSTEGWVAPVDCGAMISSDRFQSLEDIIARAQDQGAEVTTGGSRWKHPYHEHGAYFGATVVGDVTSDMDIAQQELFAPIAVVMKYEKIEEAIEIANGTRYGLGASVFGPSQDICMSVARRLECGMVSINDFGVFYLNQDMPFGGAKYSGYGRFGGPEGLRSLTITKSIIVDRWPWLIQTSIPAPLDYPIRSLTNSWDFLSGMIALVYAEPLRDRMAGLMGLIKASFR